MPGIIYQPKLPQCHHNLVLKGFSRRFLIDLQYEILDVRQPPGETLTLSIEESSPSGRKLMATRLMLIPFVTHWQSLRFGDITKKERGEIREAMLSVRSGIQLNVR